MRLNRTCMMDEKGRTDERVQNDGRVQIV
jgi:hypothetical protein